MKISEYILFENLKLDFRETTILSFNTDKLMGMLGFPGLNQENIYLFDIYPNDKELFNRVPDIQLTVKDGKYYDLSDTEIPQSAYDELSNAVISSIENAAYDKYAQVMLQMLDTGLMQMSSVKFDYYIYDSDTSKKYSVRGTAKGMIQTKVSSSDTLIKTHQDIVHIINECKIKANKKIYVSEMKDDMSNYIKTNFYYLKSFWVLFGKQRPEPNPSEFKNVFDERFFNAEMRRIEKKYNIKLKD